ncbi:MAG: hypothetical protein CNIPEHKO_02522 [Anaerolineales bacterium]|nr:hypothetical protein [Anaerolineae bacterium]MBL8104242.1 hypothetical protein [Anaerolineales bacterium]MBV6402216.1 hypothetical protein [Anaerolineales bacterium]MCC7189947.1 hypothetical protein [Anaerolineales bacterium]
MKHTQVLLVSMALLTLACNALRIPATPEQESNAPQNCPSTLSSDAEVEQARRYQESEFTNGDWEQSYTVTEFRLTVTRKSEALNSVINFDTVIFCDVTNPALNEYYSPENFAIIFQYYDTYKFLDECQTGNLRLYELAFSDAGIDYTGRFWSEILDQHHIRETLVVFPTPDQASLEQFSQALEFELPACK